MTTPHGPTIEISLSAITRNYAKLSSQLASGRCGAVVKANAYGLGMKQIAPALAKAGCREFFVATLEEGMELRGLLKGAPIYVFHGARKAEAKDFLAHRLIPVLNSKEQMAAWDNAGPWGLHIDTGMNRLGLTLPQAADTAKAAAKPVLVMTHLACADAPAHPKNKEQLQLFKEAIRHFPGVTASLANSAGVALGPEYHFDIARTGCSLYGIAQNTHRPSAVETVVKLSAPVLQYRTLASDEAVGYGATASLKKGSTVATVELGYADGFQRALSNKGTGFAAGVRVPVVGRVSMDTVSVDVTGVPEGERNEALRVTFIGSEQSVDDLADMAGTIGYEIFTRLGARVKQIYLP